MGRNRPKEIFVLRDKDTDQEVSVYGFVPFVVGGEALGGEFLVFTSHGWDFRPVEEFKPYAPKMIEFEETSPVE